MIIGKGNVASVLQDREDVIFFASGVSNSQETREEEFQRERALLMQQKRHRHLVYFSSLSIYRDNNPYNQHKKNMEKLVKERFNSYTIVRVEVIAWGKNPTTIHNVFRQMLEEQKPITIQDTWRYVVSKDEFLYWLSLIPVGECNEMNIPGERCHISEIYLMVKNGEL